MQQVISNGTVTSSIMRKGDTEKKTKQGMKRKRNI
jgi:hypothetical protein